MKTIMFTVALLALVLVGCTVTPAKAVVTVYKSPSCGCCVGYVGELESNGYDVETVTVEDMSAIKKKYNIPVDMQSCHTSVVEGYFVEGHVPVEAIEKLLAERPEVDGIALPKMPAGSPGMPGVKTGPFKIYSLLDGKPSEFVSI